MKLTGHREPPEKQKILNFSSSLWPAFSLMHLSEGGGGVSPSTAYTKPGPHRLKTWAHGARGTHQAWQVKSIEDGSCLILCEVGL